MRRLLTTCAMLLALAGPAAAQNKAILFSELDLTDTSFTCQAFTGKDFNPYGAMMGGGALIVTSGSSVTTTAASAGTFPFLNVNIGDVVSVQTGPNSFLTRYVVTKPDNDTITVNAVWNLGATGVVFSYLKKNGGTAATDGWINIGPLNQATFLIRVDQINATSIDAKVECRQSTFSTVPTIVFPPTGGQGICQTTPTGNFTAAGGCPVDITALFDACRLCFKINTDTGVNSVSASVIRIPRVYR